MRKLLAASVLTAGLTAGLLTGSGSAATAAPSTTSATTSVAAATTKSTTVAAALDTKQKAKAAKTTYYESTGKCTISVKGPNVNVTLTSRYSKPGGKWHHVWSSTLAKKLGISFGVKRLDYRLSNSGGKKFIGKARWNKPPAVQYWIPKKVADRKDGFRTDVTVTLDNGKSCSTSADSKKAKKIKT